MEAPECPLCHKKEWKHICNPKAEKVIRSSHALTITTPLPKPKREANIQNSGAVGGGVTNDRKAIKRAFDRVAYQRAYMKKWRALQKGK